MNAQAPRTWLFVAGADAAAHAAAASSGADVLVQEFEDFTPPALRPRARELSPALLERWRRRGAAVGVRINPLEGDGLADLEAAMPGGPDFVMMSKVSTPGQVALLDVEVTQLERAHGIAPGATKLVPNVESAAGLMRTFDIARASPRVAALLVASEDMVADLGTVRSRRGGELAYVRARFLVECRAAGVEAIDCPYTFSDAKGAAADARTAKKLGYRAKSLVIAAHAQVVNRVFTPSAAEIARARRIVAAFDKARAAGKDRAKVDGAWIEVPIHAAATRLLASVARTPAPRRRTRG
ncbi:MAG: CoA ester lyase [Burkholderiales bacterium]